jgi:hypothetical protein
VLLRFDDITVPTNGFFWDQQDVSSPINKPTSYEGGLAIMSTLISICFFPTIAYLREHQVQVALQGVAKAGGIIVAVILH